jgi:hypothetical protein|tara:strand:- start:254 stop:394 length:141 start_codon:yes stop_codon:yes gene_type:complete
MAKELVGIENDGIKAKVIYTENGTWFSEELKVGMTTLKDLMPDKAS